jgi:hypothetical protein
MRGIARRFDDETRQIEPFRQAARPDDAREQSRNPLLKIHKNVHKIRLSGSPPL